ncbi:MAG TPA: hypothetical protein VK524_11680 [Polyangiaceae bacterium]|nr:hypothetical protein [Polyangiaceae bacterium]
MRLHALLATLLVPALVSGCSFENYGLDYTSVALSAERADGSPAASLGGPVCVTLPVLMGSVVEERRTIDGSLAVALRATADRVELRFSGVAAGGGQSRVVTMAELEGGYRSEIELETREGQSVVVVLSAPCSPTTGTD